MFLVLSTEGKDNTQKRTNTNRIKNYDSLA